MNELAGHSLGGYHLVEEVGRGSMGVVYRGEQIALGREVAIKVLPQALARDSSYVARFIREAHIIAGLNHPNIVQIFDAGQQQSLLYFVMEFVQGPTLASLLNLDGTIPQYLAAEYAAQIADALDAAYSERNVIHRDIKPENLMLNRRGKIKVMDFGLARAPGLQSITVARTLVGSIYYSSPEQVWGNTLDNRSDIYALGVVLYEMVSGHRPFTGRSMPELTQAIVHGTLQPPRHFNPDLSLELEEIILTALARDRQHRYSEARLMAEALRALHLQPEPNASSIHQQPQRKVVQPPKRPQPQRPRYVEVEVDAASNKKQQKPSPAANQIGEEDRKYTHGYNPASEAQKQSISNTPTNLLPQAKRQMEQKQPQTAAPQPNQTELTEKPKKKRLNKSPGRPNLWHQLQHLFKSS